ncbi:MAG: nucleotidyltransferase family protein [Melioribacteraceae bacterium]|nr:nucleotidyltransferase family protein [Melioribacteraceae bacterium]
MYYKINKLNSIENLKCLVLSSDEITNRKREFLKEYSLINIEQIYTETNIDEVDSHTAFLLKECGIDLDDKWNESLNSTQNRIDNLLDELDLVAEKLNKKDIKIVALKNAGIAKGIYKNSACSPMGDIDLLVSVKDFRKAHEVLINELGYTFKFRSEFEEEDLEDAFRGGGTEYYKDVNGYKVWLELQWRPIAGRWIQPENEPDGEELLKRSVEISDSKVRILCPEDNLLQVALHTAKHSYVRAPGFRLHSDVDRIVRYTKVNWERFLEQVIKLKLKTAVYFSLGFAKTLLKTPIPDEVLKKLKPNFIRGNIIKYFIAKAGIFNQTKKKFTKIGYIIFNMALYDSLFLLLKSLLPSADNIKKLYGFDSNFKLPYYYLKRYADLLFKRAKL